jgi:site-specific recombinase XerC
MADFHRLIDNLRERIQISDHIDDDDREALLRFSDEMEFHDVEYTDARHVKLLQHCTVLAGSSPNKYDPDELPDTRLVDAIHDREELKKIARWIKRNFDSEETKRDYRVALRMFAEHVTPGDGKPDAVRELSAGTPRNYQPMPDPAKMLDWDKHIQPMIQHATNHRDKAAIAVSWDLGARSEEFQHLRIGDISDHRHGVKISVDGKRGQRSPLIIPSVPYLRQWLSLHPADDTPTAPLWSKLNTVDTLSYRMFLKMIKKPARRAGIDHTDITYRRMRKSSASYLASQNINQAHIEDHHGWKRGSNVAARYISVFGEANDREVARAHGIDVQEEEPDPTAPLDCPRCQRETPREEPLCVWCGQALSQHAAEQVDETDSRFFESAGQASGELFDDLSEIKTLLDENPALRRFLVDAD